MTVRYSVGAVSHRERNVVFEGREGHWPHPSEFQTPVRDALLVILATIVGAAVPYVALTLLAEALR